MPEPVLDMRTYTIRPRGVPEFVRLWEELMLPVALKHWGKPAAFLCDRDWSSQSGHSYLGI